MALRAIATGRRFGLKLARAAVPCAAALLVCACLAGCQHSRATTALDDSVHTESGPHYANLFGQRYRTKTDLYLFSFASSPECRYVGVNDGRALLRPPALPVGIDRSAIGQTLPSRLPDRPEPLTILDVVPAGTEFALSAETHEVTVLSGVRKKGGIAMGFICELTLHGRRLNDVLTEFIQTAKPAPAGALNQQIDPALAEKLPR